ncbi:unnamed protein product [Hyaloperonospora brassicae]|uniref:BRCT domain-containing protein n=1 Tax=Hyaloperonospora brassicae TaxID=162125 RepID=A0AAV0T0C2_HYABA|nr:unnamed protein product [Hyaloperonospora brassicae]
MAACVYDKDSPGRKTTVGPRDTSGQWHTANRRKRAASLLLAEEPTQRESQATQTATERTPSSEDAGDPVFAASGPSQEESSGPRDKAILDGKATHICMTDSGKQGGSSRSTRDCIKDTVPLTTAGDTGIGASDGDADSDMSDDLLEQVGSIAVLSSIAASLQKRKPRDKGNVTICKPCGPRRSSLALSSHDDIDSSGGETEIEGEPNEESPLQIETHPEEKKMCSKGRMPVHLARGGSCANVGLKKNSPSSERKNMGRFIATPKTTDKLTSLSGGPHCEQRGATGDSHSETKRFRRDEDGMARQSLDRALSSKKSDGRERSDGGVRYEDAKASRGCLEVANDDTQDISAAKGGQLDKLSTSSSFLASRSPHETRKSGQGRKRTHGLGGQAQIGSIRILLTGIELTAAIGKKIKSIAGAVYESDIEKATHLVAPQNQLKRTLKLLCGISCCAHILGEQWLDQSAQAGVAVDEQANCLRDVEAESKWQFDLRTTMYGVAVEHRRRLFASYSVFITKHKSLLPPVELLVKIVRCAGGKATSKGKPGPSDIVISSEAALATATVLKQLVGSNLERIYSSEFILRSILQQRVELDKYRLQVPESRKSKRR